jgi:hypothetical protein
MNYEIRLFVKSIALYLLIIFINHNISFGFSKEKPPVDKTINNKISSAVIIKKDADKIVFCNNDSTILKEIKIFYYPSVSPDKNKIAIIEKSNKDYVSIYDGNGSLTKKFKIPNVDTNRFLFGIEKIAVSNNGSIVTVNEKRGELFSRVISFYDSSINHICNIKVESYDFPVVFLDNENIVVLLQVSKKIDKFPSKEYASVVELQCYQINGKLKWKYQINDLNFVGVDSSGMSLEKQGLDVLYVDQSSKRVYVKGISNLGYTRKDLWQKYKRNINPEGKAIWIFDYEGNLLEKEKGW